MGYLKKISVSLMAIMAALILLGANVASAGNSDLDVSFNVPSSVKCGALFTITVNVHNPSAETVTFNRVAATYALWNYMKIKGPYEVDTATHSLAPGASTSFSFNFRILYGSGTIVPVAVIFAQDSYQNQNMRGGGVVGIKVE